MMRQYLELTGLVGPRMDGLEGMLEEVAAGQLSADDAAARIRTMAQSGRERLLRKIAILAPILGGCIFTIVGVVCGMVNYLSVANAVATDGTVTSVARGKTHFEYAVDGTVYTGESWIESDLPEHTVGDKLRVLYQKDHPSKARIDSFTELWLFPTVFPLLGILSMIGGGVTYLVLKRYA